MTTQPADVPIGELAQRVGISTRTLRHYDAIGLLPPSRTDHAGQRFYDDEAVAVLLRIVALRDLGLGLEAIREMLSRPTSSVDALAEHSDLLREQISRLSRQLASVTTTLQSLRSKESIMTERTFDGFDPEVFEQEVTERWGAAAHQQSIAAWNSMSAEEKEAELALSQSLVDAFASADEQGLPPEDPRVQAICRRHVAWLARYTDPTPAYIRNLVPMYADDPRFDATYRGHGAYVRDALLAYVDSGAMGPG
ncbi:MerR family transcriptional regulator [Brachybacterium halotolerans subsp. kimchii]|uniref:MerR family transcriptional regulator n=1 Tax=Brachybacterium halotolerans TaxID=2795215 RepID=UPI001E645CE3|nr:MerR family transcriptional regulator [Brachybacterium halotolerans]UEJ81222.1 MerR family transcriptional regulator [Brachybacterium halotolerans subsp. kimchii]